MKLFSCVCLKLELKLYIEMRSWNKKKVKEKTGQGVTGRISKFKYFKLFFN